MGRKNRKPLAERVAGAAEKSLTAQNYVSPLDVLMGMGWAYARRREALATGAHR